MKHNLLITVLVLLRLTNGMNVSSDCSKILITVFRVWVPFFGSSQIMGVAVLVSLLLVKERQRASRLSVPLHYSRSTVLFLSTMDGHITQRDVLSFELESFDIENITRHLFGREKWPTLCNGEYKVLYSFGKMRVPSVKVEEDSDKWYICRNFSVKSYSHLSRKRVLYPNLHSLGIS